MRRPELVDPEVWQASKEIALAIADQLSVAAVGQVVMDAVARMVGFDLGSIITTSPGAKWSMVGHVGGWPDNRFLEENFSRFALEMSAAEHRAMARGFSPVDAIFEPRRRQSLAIFREFLRPRGLNQVLCVAWASDDQIWTLGLTRTSRAFSDRAIARLTDLSPHIRAAWRSLAWRSTEDQRTSMSAELDVNGLWGLTGLQGRAMNLVRRGLTNKEVAGLLGISPNTVRNTLVEVFRKVGVSRRSELTFVASAAAGEAKLRRGDLLGAHGGFLDSIMSELASRAPHPPHVRREAGGARGAILHR